MSIYKGYLKGKERKEAILEAALDVEFNKYMTMYEMLNMQLDQMRREAELKVFRENGDYDDLQYLLEEANEEVGEKKKNIFQKIWGVIAGIFKAIGNFIKKAFSGEDAPEEVEITKEEVGEEEFNRIGFFQKNINKIKDGFNRIKQGDFTGALSILGGILPFLGIAIGTFFGVKTVANIAGNKLIFKKNQVEEVTALSGLATAAADSIAKGGVSPKEDSNDGEKKESPFSAVTNAVRKFANWLQSLVNRLTGFFKKDNKKDESNENEKDEKEDKFKLTEDMGSTPINDGSTPINDGSTPDKEKDDSAEKKKLQLSGWTKDGLDNKKKYYYNKKTHQWGESKADGTILVVPEMMAKKLNKSYGNAISKLKDSDFNESSSINITDDGKYIIETSTFSDDILIFTPVNEDNFNVFGESSTNDSLKNEMSELQRLIANL